MLKEFSLAVQIITSVILTLLIIIQSKGSGLSKAWGISASSFARRGLERILFKGTFVIAGIFILVSVIQII